MPINPIPGKGLEITLDEYTSLQVCLGGSDLWSLSNQQILTKKLAPFLPRMEYNPANNSVVASMLVYGQEVMSTSRPIPTHPAAIPASCMARLQAAIEAVKDEAAASSTDPAVRELIRAFSFPNPLEAPELYRLIGSENAPKLVFLWGLEKRGCRNIPMESMQLQRHFVAMRGNPFTLKNLIIGGSVAALALLALMIHSCGGDGEGAAVPAAGGTPVAAAPGGNTQDQSPAPQAGGGKQQGKGAASQSGGGGDTQGRGGVAFRYQHPVSPDANGCYKVTFTFKDTSEGPFTGGTATINDTVVRITPESKATFTLPPGKYTIVIRGVTASGVEPGVSSSTVVIPKNSK